MMGSVGEVRITPDLDTSESCLRAGRCRYAGGPGESGRLRREGAELAPIDESPCYSSPGFHPARDYIIDLVVALNQQGLEVEHYYPKTARATVISHGLWADFASKPLPGQAGNSGHPGRSRPGGSRFVPGSRCYSDANPEQIKKLPKVRQDIAKLFVLRAARWAGSRISLRIPRSGPKSFRNFQ
jgi:hypothetical protein